MTDRCSRAGCTTVARWAVNWRNPRIHGPERVKVWLACDDHVDFLRDYLATRDFPVAVTDAATGLQTPSTIGRPPKAIA